MENSENNLVILLTGTINPNSFSNLTIKNPEIRRQQYLDAIKFYLKHTKFKIVFTENSGDQLKNFPTQPGRIEYLSFESAPIIPDRGKAYKEMEIIDFALQNSSFLREAKSVVKITGRLKVLNIKMLSRKFIKLKNIKSNLVYVYSYKLKNMDSRCFFFTLDFWPYLKFEGRNISQKYNFELTLWDATYEYQKLQGKNFLPFDAPLRIKGVSGAYGNNYKHNLLTHYARLIRYIVIDRWWNERYHIFKN